MFNLIKAMYRLANKKPVTVKETVEVKPLSEDTIEEVCKDCEKCTCTQQLELPASPLSFEEELKISSPEDTAKKVMEKVAKKVKKTKSLEPKVKKSSKKGNNL